MNANQNTRRIGGVVNLSSILPPILADVRERMRQGESVSVDELRNALRTVKPLEAPTKVDTRGCLMCGEQFEYTPDCHYCPACCESYRREICTHEAVTLNMVKGEKPWTCAECGAQLESREAFPCDTDAEELGDMGREDF